MKKLLFILSGIFTFLSTNAQINLAIDSMEINDIKVKLLADGQLLNLETKENGQYKSLIYSQNLWLGGQASNGNLHVSGQTYRQGRVNFHPGPVSNDSAVSSKYNQVYHLNIDTLTAFVHGFTNGIPAAIANWPAHGDTSHGESYYLAPFVDVNQDGQYRPADGDYPEIKGDEALFAIFNDINGDSSGNRMGVEIHAMLYGFKNSGAHDSVLYLDYQLYNRSDSTYSHSYLSSFIDYDLGNASDDLVGTNVSAQSTFAYNSDNDDEGSQGFSRLANCGLRIFKGPPADYFDALDNNMDGCIDGIRDANGNCIAEDSILGIREHYLASGSMNFQPIISATGLPNNDLEYYNCMRSMWKGGNSVIIENPDGFGSNANGDGYVASNIGTAALFCHTGNSFDTTGAFPPSQPLNWFASPLSQGDVRASSNAGPFTLEAGQSFDIKAGIVWSISSTNQSGYDLINDRLSNLHNLYNNTPVSHVGLPSPKPLDNYQLYFAPGRTSWVVQNKGAESQSFKVFGINGQLLHSFKMEGFSNYDIRFPGSRNGIYLLVNTGTGRAHKISL